MDNLISDFRKKSNASTGPGGGLTTAQVNALIDGKLDPALVLQADKDSLQDGQINLRPDYSQVSVSVDTGINTHTNAENHPSNADIDSLIDDKIALIPPGLTESEVNTLINDAGHVKSDGSTSMTGSLVATGGDFGASPSKLRALNLKGAGFDGRMNIQGTTSGDNPGLELTNDDNGTRVLIRLDQQGTGTDCQVMTQRIGGGFNTFIFKNSGGLRLPNDAVSGSDAVRLSQVEALIAAAIAAIP